VNSLKGHLLIAAQRLLDPNFARSVLLIFEHSSEGAAGLVLNRPTDKSIAEIAQSVFDEDLDWPKAIHLGGPVPGPILVLHTDAAAADQELLPGVYSTVDSEKLLDLLRRQVEPSVILANYAGWGPGQLEREMEEESWLTLPADEGHVFWTSEDDIWMTLIRQIGRESLASVARIDTQAIDPNLN
jgi:putative transcriptional regulator